MWIVGLVAGLIALDLAHVDRLEGNRTIIVPEVDTEMLGESTVVVVCCATVACPTRGACFLLKTQGFTAPGVFGGFRK